MVHCMAERIMQRSCYTNVVKEREECLVYDKKHTGQWISWDESVSYIRNCFFPLWTKLSIYWRNTNIFNSLLISWILFMLSGFLFAKGVLDGKYRNKSLILIIKDRIMRLWPTYIVGLIFCLLCILWLGMKAIILSGFWRKSS